jgi:hypothetical protein
LGDKTERERVCEDGDEDEILIEYGEMRMGM